MSTPHQHERDELLRAYLDGELDAIASKRFDEELCVNLGDDDLREAAY
jgi:hypothetical protein